MLTSGGIVYVLAISVSFATLITKRVIVCVTVLTSGGIVYVLAISVSFATLIAKRVIVCVTVAGALNFITAKLALQIAVYIHMLADSAFFGFFTT